MSWCDLDSTFDLAVVTLSKNLFRSVSQKPYGVGCCYLVETLVGDGCRCATSCCDLDLTFDLAIVTLIFKILSQLYLRN